jgi:hypothetical protein
MGAAAAACTCRTDVVEMDASTAHNARKKEPTPWRPALDARTTINQRGEVAGTGGLDGLGLGEDLGECLGDAPGEALPAVVDCGTGLA